MNKFILPIGIAIAMTSCDTTKNVVEEVVEETVVIAEDAANISQTIDLDYLNTTVRPQDDFFEFSNGTWMTNNPVPPSESRWGSFNELDQSNKKKLTALLNEASNLSTGKGSTNQILGDYYKAYLNTALRNKQGVSGIQAELDLIKSMISKNELTNVIARHHNLGVSSLFGFGIGQDLKDVENHAVYFGQSGIGLPNKDYYTSDDKAEIKAKYQVHIQEMFEMLGESSTKASEISKSVVIFEEKLAEAMMAPATYSQAGDRRTEQTRSPWPRGRHGSVAK